MASLGGTLPQWACQWGEAALGEVSASPIAPRGAVSYHRRSTGGADVRALWCGVFLVLGCTPPEEDPTSTDDTAEDVAGPCVGTGIDPRPFDETADAVVYGEVVKDLSWPTLGDPFVLSEHWTGCDAFVLLPVDQPFMAEDLAPMFSDADPHTVFLFLSTRATKEEATADVTAWRTEVRAALQTLPDDDRLHWRERVHYMTPGTNNADLDEIVRGLEASDVVGIDTRQRLRRGGSLAVSSSGGWFPLASHARYTAKGHLYEARLEDRLTREEAELGDDLLVVPVIDGTWADLTVTEGAQVGIVDLQMPAAADLARFDRVEVVVEERCATSDFPHQGEGCSGEAGFSVDVCRDDCGDGDEIQAFFRAISGYATGGTWTYDATAALPWFKQGSTRVRIDGRAAGTEDWRLRVRLRFHDDTDDDDRSPTTAAALDGWTGINLRAAYSELTQVYEVTPPPGTTGVELVVLATSHGGGGNGGCAEFCDIESTVAVNGVVAAEHQWEMKDTWDCAARVELGVTPNQWGTWYFDRASWCPGFTAEQWTADLTDAFDLDGPNVLERWGTQSYAFPTSGGFPNTNWLVFRGGDGSEPTVVPVERPSCTNVSARLRDFDDTFEDFWPLVAAFEALDGADPDRVAASEIVEGAVATTLSEDGVPVLAWPENTLPFTTAARFDQWFQDVQGVNVGVDVDDRVVRTHLGTGMIRGHAPSPHTVAPVIDDAFGFGPDDNGRNGTKTIHVSASFVHEAGTVLRFGSGDDLWVFVDGTLALDRGGFHGSLFTQGGPSRTDLLDLDTLGLTVGETHTIDAFLVDRGDDGSWTWWAEVPDCAI